MSIKTWKVDDRGPRKGVHRHAESGTVTWGLIGRWWRLGVRVMVHQHCQPGTSDRWVVSPLVSYDRIKTRPSGRVVANLHEPPGR